MGCVIHVTPYASTANAHGFRRRIHVHVLDRREIDDQTIVANPQPSGIVASATNRNFQILLRAEPDRGDYVSHIGALRNQTGLAADHGVIDLARLVVARIGGLNYLTSKLALELQNCFLLHNCLHSAKTWRTPCLVLRGLATPAVFQEWPSIYGRASYTMLNGVSVARRNRLNPAVVTTSRMRDSPAWAPRHNPTSCDREHGVHSKVEKE